LSEVGHATSEQRKLRILEFRQIEGERNLTLEPGLHRVPNLAGGVLAVLGGRVVPRSPVVQTSHPVGGSTRLKVPDDWCQDSFQFRRLLAASLVVSFKFLASVGNGVGGIRHLLAQLPRLLSELI
jgi:hypothetical protein